MRKAVKIIFAVVIAAFVISTVRYCANPYSTETVTYYEYEKSISGTGYILRDETIVTNDAPGVFEPFVNDGERVSRGAKVGTVISGRPDEELLGELAGINERIEDIEKSEAVAGLYQSDALRIANAVSTNVKSIREAVRTGDYAKAAELKKEIGYLKGRSGEIEGSDARDELLAELYDRKANIESAVGGAQSEIYAPIAGVYSSVVDGLEKYGTPEAMAELMPSTVEAFDKAAEDFERSASDVCKITDNYNWYLAAVITEEEAENVKVGSGVSVLIDSADAAEVDASVYSLSEAEDGKRVMIVKSNEFADGISSMRSVDYKVVLLRKTGLKIPSSALRIENGKKGVYILIDKKKSFKYVNNEPFRSEDDQFYIVNRKYTPQGSGTDYVPLKEFDKVLLNPEDVR